MHRFVHYINKHCENVRSVRQHLLFSLLTFSRKHDHPKQCQHFRFFSTKFPRKRESIVSRMILTPRFFVIRCSCFAASESRFATKSLIISRARPPLEANYFHSLRLSRFFVIFCYDVVRVGLLDFC